MQKVCIPTGMCIQISKTICYVDTDNHNFHKDNQFHQGFFFINQREMPEHSVHYFLMWKNQLLVYYSVQIEAS